ncbi:uncharacterized protein KY384_005258 [Bacidia gigantensis]|uniref:uncharacterized protein n=1 Tax=Bacidia gigantensis TaxID=2732470 RepID=UPI001D04C638|nr:uncharacterized protein KY384_005258 [Bacidia gigantensis]KAG8529777.1 hypothetical protein KY384_005258 [Bacidia gigantensis]
MPSDSRGALIVIEGLDRAGKSTQHGRLCEHLESAGHSVKKLRFPGNPTHATTTTQDRDTSIGTSISSYLKGASNLEDHVIHLLFSANRWEATPGIIRAIEAGTSVVVDRYYYSGIVYSAAKKAAGISLQWAKAPDVGLPKPDLVVFLDLDQATAKARGGYGEERYENEEMQKRVRELFFRSHSSGGER